MAKETGTLKWLGPGYFGQDVAPGDDMPEIEKNRLEKFIKAGKVGTIAKKIDLENIKSDKINALKKENDALKKENDALKKENDTLKKGK